MPIPPEGVIPLDCDGHLEFRTVFAQNKSDASHYQAFPRICKPELSGWL